MRRHRTRKLPQRAQTLWRDLDEARLAAAYELFEALSGLRWSPALLEHLTCELNVDGDVERLFGAVERIPRSKYPQLVATAIALRYSWREDTFRRVAHEFLVLMHEGRMHPRRRRR